MQTEQSPHFLHHLNQRLGVLIWQCIDAELYKTALFYAERYFALDPTNHDARHAYATAFLRTGQPLSAHNLVIMPADQKCAGCAEIRGRCLSALGRHRQAGLAMEECWSDRNYTPTRAFLAHPKLPSVLIPASVPFHRCGYYRIHGLAHCARIPRGGGLTLSCGITGAERQFARPRTHEPAKSARTEPTLMGSV